MSSDREDNSTPEIPIKTEPDANLKATEVDTPPRWRNENESQEDCVQIQEQAALDGVKFLESMKSLLNGRVQKIPDCPLWSDKIEKILQDKSQPTVSIGFVGATGSGKSALVSALCGIEGLLPSGSDRATTAVVTRIIFNNSDDPAELFRAEIELVTEDELKLELDTLLNDINARKDSGDQLDEAEAVPLNVETTQIVEQARGRVLTLFPDHNAKTLENVTSEELLADEAISEILGTTKIFRQNNTTDFFSDIKPFIDSTPTRQGGRRKFAYWPLVKLVTLYIKVNKLRGLALYDLPGSLDTNAARGTVADKFKKNLNMTCVVARVVRGADDSSAHELLADADALRLKLDGNYNGEHLVYVMSMCDHLKVPEYFQNYPEFKEYMADELTVEVELTRSLKMLSKEKNDGEGEVIMIEKQLKKVQKEIRKVMSDAGLVKSRKRKQPGDHTLLIPKTIPERTQKQLEVLTEKEKHLESQTRDMKSKSFNINKQIEKSSKRLRDTQSRIRAACIQDRNRCATEKVKANFRDERAELASERAKDSEGRSKDLQVFCVSSEAYFQTLNLEKYDLPPIGFHDRSLTNILQLRKFCQNSSLDLRQKFTSAFLTDVNGFRRSMKTWADDKAFDVKITSQDRLNANAFFEVHLESLEQQLNILRDFSVELIRQGMTTEVRKAVSHAVGTAMKAAQKTGRGWEAIHWSTYKAICGRSGTFRSNKGVFYDWNDEMGNNLLRPLLDTWDRCFNDELPKLYAKHADEACSRVLSHDEDLMESVRDMHPVLVGPLRSLRESSLDVRHELKGDIETILDNLKGKIREVHAIAKPVIQELMEDVYSACYVQKGRGTHAANKEAMKLHIKNVGRRMFQEAATKMNAAFDAVVNNLKVDFNRTTKNAIDQISIDFEEMLDKYTTDETLTGPPRAPSKDKLELQEKILSAIEELDRLWAKDSIVKADDDAKFKTSDDNCTKMDEVMESEPDSSSDSDDLDLED